MEDEKKQAFSKFSSALQKIAEKKSCKENIELVFDSLPYGGMLWWKKCEDAARYLVQLGVREYSNTLPHVLYGEHELCEVEKDRNTFYHSFSDLAALDSYFADGRWKVGKYFARVVAENRNGEIFAASKVIEFKVKDIRKLI